MTMGRRPGAWLAAALMLIALLARPQDARGAACAELESRGVLNVLSLNLLYSEIGTRDERLATIASFVATNQVDVLLLQEVVAGRLAGTPNSAQDLQRILREEEGLEYDLRTAYEAGLPRILAVANATLARCEIAADAIEALPVAEAVEVGPRTIGITRNVLWTRFELPGAVPVSVYNTHLCSGCSPAEKAAQLEAVLAFIEQNEGAFDGPVVLGGDLNLDALRGVEHRALYDRIVEAGFVDVHAEAVAEPLENLCPDRQRPDEHCTLGVGLDREALEGQLLTLDVPLLNRMGFSVPRSFRLPQPAVSSARRVDYVFARGFGPVDDGRVVFNARVDPEAPAVSDHAGVFARLALPETPTRQAALP